MKTLLKKITPVILILTLIVGVFSICLIGIFSNNQIAFAETDSSTFIPSDIAVEEENLVSSYATIDAIEDQLAQNNTTVINELQKQLNNLNEKLLSNSYNSRENIINLIKTTEDLIEKYSAYENRNITRAPYHLYYTPVIASVIAYFNSKNYILSAELLTHAKNNETLNSLYTIEYTNKIIPSSKFKEIAFGTSTSGDTFFTKTGNEYDDDTHYAINEFDYQKSMPNSRTVRIMDTYDFGPEDYTGVEGFAIDQMYNAQQAGALIPYKIDQLIADTTTVTFKSTGDKYQETFDLAKKETRNINLTVIGASKINVKFSGIKSPMYVDARCMFWGETKRNVSDATKSVLKVSYDCSSTVTTIMLSINNNILIQKDNSMTITITCE